MIGRAAIGVVVALLGLAAMLLLAPGEAAMGWRIAALTVAAPAIGGVLMLAIARLTGANWLPFTPLAGAAPVAVLAAIGIGLAQIAAPVTAHPLYQSPLLVGLRGAIATAALAWAGVRLIAGASVTFAAITLAVYALAVTAVGTDWMLAKASGHAVSSIGMILFVEQFGAACAVALLLDWGEPAFRRDIARLLVAAALGLAYLVFMDYLIIWFGNLPARVGWYAQRRSPGAELTILAALACGLGLPVAAQALIGGERGWRIAGVGALVGLLLFNWWWVGGGVLALEAAGLAALLLAALGALLIAARRHGHG